MLSAVRGVVFRSVSSKMLWTTPQVARAASVWGGDAWRYDKAAFKQWITAAMDETSIEKRQLYAHLALAFGDADVDKDGFINKPEFDRLLENVAALPRRFGMAPSWRAEYGDDKDKRIATRGRLFDSIDGTAGFQPRGKIAMGQFLNWSYMHIYQKEATIDSGKVAFRHVEDHTKEQYIAYLDKAVNDPHSGASVTFYNYLLTVFVEGDVQANGKVSFEDFDKLVDVAAATPRFFGLAPDIRDEAERKAMFGAMDVTGSGFVTFRKFLRFVREHVKEKLAEHAK